MNDVVKTSSVVSHKTWGTPAISSLIHDTRQALLAWGFPVRTRNTSWDDKCPLWTRTPYDNPPESWPNQTKGVLLVTSCLGTPVYSTSHQIYPSKCISWMAEIRQNILTGQNDELSRYKRRWKVKSHLVFTYGNHSKVCLNRRRSGENC